MSYALSGSTPSPIPPTNTPEVRDFTVGSYAMGIPPGVPWLDANLIVRNVLADQAARMVPDLIRAALIATGATVDDVRWVAGGYVHARWRPNSERPAISYASSVQGALLEAALRLSPRSQIILTRFRVNMPTGRTDLYVYAPAPPAPPAPLPGTIPSPPAEAAPPAEEEAGGGFGRGVAAVVALAALGGLGYYLSRQPSAVRKNRNMLHRSRRSSRNRRRSR